MEMFPALPFEDLNPRKVVMVQTYEMHRVEPSEGDQVKGSEVNDPKIVRLSKNLRVTLYKILYQDLSQDEVKALLLEMKSQTGSIVAIAGGVCALPDDPFALREAFLALEGKSVDTTDEGIVLFRNWSKSPITIKTQDNISGKEVTKDDGTVQEPIPNTVNQGDSVTRIVKAKPGNTYSPESGVQESGHPVIPPNGLCPLCKSTPDMRANHQGCDACNPT